jgi:hypothetical protein
MLPELLRQSSKDLVIAHEDRDESIAAANEAIVGDAPADFLGEFAESRFIQASTSTDSWRRTVIRLNGKFSNQTKLSGRFEGGREKPIKICLSRQSDLRTSMASPKRCNSPLRMKSDRAECTMQPEPRIESRNIRKSSMVTLKMIS